jgi:stage V sporulation protein G
MPSRKLTDRCMRCQYKNCLRAVYCGQCGARLPVRRAARCQDGRSKLYADIAHPINSACREAIQSHVIDAFEHEKVLAQQPGYVCRYDDFGCDEDVHFEDWSDASAAESERSRRVEPAAEIEGPHTARRLGAEVARSNLSEAEDDFGAGVIAAERL